MKTKIFIIQELDYNCVIDEAIPNVVAVLRGNAKYDLIKLKDEYRVYASDFHTQEYDIYADYEKKQKEIKKKKKKKSVNYKVKKYEMKCPMFFQKWLIEVKKMVPVDFEVSE